MGEEQVIAARALIDYANAGLENGDRVYFVIAEYDTALLVTAAVFERNVAKLTTDAGVHYIAFSAVQGVQVIAPAKGRISMF